MNPSKVGVRPQQGKFATVTAGESDLVFTNTKIDRISHTSKTNWDILNLQIINETEDYQNHFYMLNNIHFCLVVYRFLMSFPVLELARFKDLKNDRKMVQWATWSWVKSIKIDKICDVMWWTADSKQFLIFYIMTNSLNHLKFYRLKVQEITQKIFEK